MVVLAPCSKPMTDLLSPEVGDQMPVARINVLLFEHRTRISKMGVELKC